MGAKKVGTGQSVEQVSHTWPHIYISSLTPRLVQPRRKQLTYPISPDYPYPIPKITKLPPGIYQKERKKTSVPAATYDLPEQKSG